MSSALALEKTMTIAYLGPEATFTHQAAIQRSARACATSPQKTIADVFTEVSKNRADYGVVPVENSTEGVVTHTLDMFVDSDLKDRCANCSAGAAMPAEQRAAWHRSKSFTSIRNRSAQCRGWMQNNLPRVGNHRDLVQRAFGGTGRQGEELGGHRRRARRRRNTAVPVLEQDIQDNAANATRFLVLGRQCSPPTGRRPHQPDVQRRRQGRRAAPRRWPRSAATKST